MNPLRRQQTLDALGLTRWVRRGADTVSVVAAPRPELAAPDASTASQPRQTLVAEAIPAVTVSRQTPVPVPAATPSSALPPVPEDWQGLRDAVAGCTRCKLCHSRTHTVFGAGPQTASLMVIGEGPGADEDATGEAFVGRAGKLLDEMLKAIGYSRNHNTFIANVVKCRPPGNRDPETDEVEACRPYLEAQIRLIKPRLIVGLGRVAARRLLNTDLPMSKLRGALHHYPQAADESSDGEPTPVMLTYHPAYLLRSPREKAKSWADLKRIHRFLNSSA